MRLGTLIIVIVALLLSYAVFASPKADPIVLDLGNHSSLREEVNAATVNKVLQGIVKSDQTKPYYLFLDSPGGKVLEGRRLVAYLQSTNRNIICVAQTAISMAYVILQACPVRLVTGHTILMAHQIAGGMNGSLREMKAAVNFTEKLANFYDQLIADRMGLTLEEYRGMINPELWFVGVKEAIDGRAADAEVKVNCTKELEKATEVIETVKVSKCPIAG